MSSSIRNWDIRFFGGNGLSEEVARIALYHHERIDGSGYPHHLEGRGIPLYARIVAISDFYDAITNDRIYRKRMTPENAYREIIRTTSNPSGRGGWWRSS